MKIFKHMSLIFITSYISITQIGASEKICDLTPRLGDPWTISRNPTDISEIKDEIYRNRVSKFITSLEQPTQLEKTLQIGDFFVNLNHLLGEGEEGAVYFAIHKSTGTFAAAKKFPNVNNEQPQVFKDIGRLYYETIDPYNRLIKWMFTPLVINGLSMAIFYTSSFHSNAFQKEKLGIIVNKVNQITYQKFEYNLNLMEALLREMEYCAQNMAFPNIYLLSDTYIVESPGKKPQAIFLDVSIQPYEDPSYRYVLNWSESFWGIRKYIDSEKKALKEGYSVPPAVSLFLNDYLESLHTSYPLSRFRTLVTQMREAWEKDKKEEESTTLYTSAP